MSDTGNLLSMSRNTPTQFWNDSCSIPELTYAISQGAVGATSNPEIVGLVLKNETQRYIPYIERLLEQYPKATEDDIAWLLGEHMAVEGAKLLYPIYEKNNAANGCISIQTNAKFYRDEARMVEQALHFDSLAENIMVKIPITAAGVKAIEEATYRGVTVNATVSFSVPQVIAAAEAMERGLERRAKEGRKNDGINPVCTVMVGRIEDWLRETAEMSGKILDPVCFDMSGVAIFKNAYRIFKERKYKARLLVAAYRNHFHWSEFIGGDISMTIPPKWIKLFNYCDVTVENRMDNPVEAKILNQLSNQIGDFNRAYEPDGLKICEFDSFGAAKVTLTKFLSGYDNMISIIRGIMINM
ncbi:MAG: transaldolase [Oscillospiraceae bacterium]|nr:transaldolase [Oscillospiraceae bacterium]